MVYECAVCGSRIATAGDDDYQVVCGGCGTVVREGRADEPIPSTEPSPELLLLPPELRARSFSSDEIFLEAADALVALDHLERAGALVVYCDCLVGADDRWHYEDTFRGLRRLAAAGADHASRVADAAAQCRKVIRDHMARFGQRETGERLYFAYLVELAS